MNKGKNKRTHVMAGILMASFIGAFLIIMGRFIYIQVSGEVNGVSLAEWAKQKRTATYYLESERGEILDDQGMVLAYDRAAYRVYAIVDESFSEENEKKPKHVKEPEKTAEQLAPLLDLDKSFILERLEKAIKNKNFQVEFGSAGKELTKEEKEEIEKLNLPGINFSEESIRFYPNGMFASHILGYTRKVEIEEDEKKERQSNVEEITGIAGIEKEMNEYLMGEDGSISFERDKYNRKLLDPNEIIKEPVNGDNIYLTIDQKVQTLLEEVMNEVDEDYQPERITAIIMNAKTGEIIAMSNRPTYDPNKPTSVKNWYNDVISTPYEPGSTVKMFTWAAAIDAGVYDGEKWYESGKYRVNERMDTVNDHNGGTGWGSITYDEGFTRSSNVAASKIVWEILGTEKYLEYLKAFDFDKETNIDLPGEVPGQILYNWPMEKITTGFGQGSTMTPIQQVKAASAITNEGKMLEPYVIKKIVDSDTGDVLEEQSPKVAGEPISKETADQVLELLDSVVNSKHGTGKPYKLEDYTVIGKTGTAEIPNPDGSGYLGGANTNIFSFLGMSPKDDPELIMHVSVNQPNLAEGEQGSAPVSYIFKSVMENSLHYLDIDSDKNVSEPIQALKVPALIDTKTKTTKEQLIKEGFNVTVIGTGKTIVNANVKEGDELLANDRLILLTDKPVMPMIKGWSLREVLQLGELLDLKVDYSGTGYVDSQNIEEGKKVKGKDILKIELKPFVDSIPPDQQEGEEKKEKKKDKKKDKKEKKEKEKKEVE